MGNGVRVRGRAGSNSVVGRGSESTVAIPGGGCCLRCCAGVVDEEEAVDVRCCGGGEHVLV